MNERTVHALTVGVYDAAIGRTSWSALLADVAQAFDAAATFIFTNARPPNAPVFIGLWGATPDAQRDYREHYAARNVLLVDKESWHQPGTVRTSEMLCTRQELLGSEYYADFMRRYDYRYSVGVTIPYIRHRSVHVGGYRAHRSEAFDATAVDAISRLLPHLERAFEVQARLGVANRMLPFEAMLNEQVSSGVAYLDADGQIIFANRSFDQIVSSGDGLSRRRGRVECASRRSAAAYTRAVALAQKAQGHLVVVDRPSGRSPYSMMVMHVPSAPDLAGTGRAAVLLVITDPAAVRQPDSGYLERAHGLTRREAVIATRLAQGDTLQDIADAFQLSIHTVRTHVKRCLAKTSSRRQADLVRLVLSAQAGRVGR